MDISEFTKNKFPFAYEQAIRMCDNLSKVLHKELPESEIGYLALHLERILSSAISNYGITLFYLLIIVIVLYYILSFSLFFISKIMKEHKNVKKND